MGDGWLRKAANELLLTRFQAKLFSVLCTALLLGMGAMFYFGSGADSPDEAPPREIQGTIADCEEFRSGGAPPGLRIRLEGGAPQPFVYRRPAGLREQVLALCGRKAAVKLVYQAPGPYGADSEETPGSRIVGMYEAQGGGAVFSPRDYRADLESESRRDRTFGLVLIAALLLFDGYCLLVWRGALPSRGSSRGG